MTARARVPIRRALVSVSDKSGLADFGRFLSAHGVEILSTGGSARALAEAGVARQIRPDTALRDGGYDLLGPMGRATALGGLTDTG